MDITVDITDYKSLSQSDLIMRNLFATVQIGNNTRESRRGVLLQEAKFRSGTIENPLVVTLKNSQTETVMYVRNIPMSTVAERNGLFNQWVAVYPPGDPQNLHFDAAAVPKLGCPQVCISVSIQEDLLSTVLPARRPDQYGSQQQQRNSMGFDFQPHQRLSVDEAAKADSLRRSIGSLTAELERERGLGPRASAGSVPGSGLLGGEVDSTVREKELQAQRIKQHVAEMASAQRRAHDFSRVLQDNLRILEDMKRQLKGLEMQIAEQRVATQLLERDRDQLLSDERELEEQIRSRDIAFKELRDSRDEIDRELTRVLSEGERQKNLVETSMRDFSRQSQSILEDIDQSKRKVVQLSESLKLKEHLVAVAERQAREHEASRAAKDIAERDSLRAKLDETRAAMQGARCNLEETQRRSLTVDMDHKEVRARLEGIESEVQSLTGAVQGTAGDRYNSRGGDAKADLEVKKEKLEVQAKKVQRLEAELSGNREQLEKLSSRIAELHTEAHDKELAAKRCEDERMELQRRLEAHQRGAAEALGQKSDRQNQVEQAERELNEVRAALSSLEETALAGSEDAEAAELELRVQQKREQLAEARIEVDALQKKCDEMEEEAGTRRGHVQEKASALEAAQSKVAELAKQLSEVSGDVATSGEALQQLEADLLSQTSGLEDIRRRARERMEGLAAMKAETAKEGGEVADKVASLDATVTATKGEIERLAVARREAEMNRMNLEGSLAENQLSLKEITDRIAAQRAERQRKAEELRTVEREHEAALAELRRGGEELKELEGAASAGASDLESTQGAIAVRIREMADLERECKEVVAKMEAEAAELAKQREEKRQGREALLVEIEGLRAERDAAATVVSTTKKEAEELDAELNRALQARVGLLKDSEDALSRTEAQVQLAAARSQTRAQRNKELEGTLTTEEGRRATAFGRLEVLREEIQAEEARVESAQGALSQKDRDLCEVRAELERQRAEAARLQGASDNLETEAKEMEARCRTEEEAAAELRSLQRKKQQLEEEIAAEDRLHMETLERRRRELEDAQSQMHRLGSETLLRKDEEIRCQEEQIRVLEAERDVLLRQVASLDSERSEVEERLLERERVKAGVAMSSQRKAQECGELESTIREAHTCAEQLQKRHTEWEAIIVGIAEREKALRAEAEEMTEHIRKARQEMADANEQADREVAAANEQVDKLRETCVVEQAEADRIRHGCAKLREELHSAVGERNRLESDEAELREGLAGTRRNLADVKAAGERQQSLAAEQADRVEQLQEERDRAGRATDSAAAMRQTVQEFEDSLQELSGRLMEAQEVVRRRRAEEEELRAEIQKLRESIRSTSDKMAYQMEHSNLQFETIQKLEEQKIRFQGEVEVLTLGLHDAEQRNDYLQKENSVMQQQVEGLYEGSLQDWAAEVHRVKVETEVAQYKEEIDVWKQKAEQMRREKQQELAGLQRQHDETVRRLRERAVAVQLEIDNCEQAARRREAALAKQRESGGAEGTAAAAAAATPGLVVPQRPLPQNHQRRKALLVGVNYSSSHAPLKGCVNDLWNLQCLLRHTLQYGDDQLRLLIDTVDGRPQKPDRVPTKANLQAGLRWLVGGAQPGDSLLFVFCGYGAQHPRRPGSDQYEGYLVPVDFAADLPANFFDRVNRLADGCTPEFVAAAAAEGQGYRLLPMLEVADLIAQLPSLCRMTVMMDCCYALIPGAGIGSPMPSTFPKVARGQVDYSKLRDFISRPRFLELPPLPLPHTPAGIPENPVPKCWLHCFSGCKLEEWSAEFPIEGTVQGAFSWAFLKALARGHFHCGLYQFQRVLTEMLADLKAHFRGVEQTPVLQLSQAANMQDVVLWT